jgi:4-amino-4-deoxy-L-arabinose transferase-like glycosyltransferase
LAEISEKVIHLVRIQNTHIRKGFWWLIIISLLIRAFPAYWLEFGNDEVYYTLYARFPDWSYFDHPPMLAWFMRLSTLEGILNHEFFFRLTSVILFTINTILIFNIGKTIRNERTGLFAAILYNTSIYSFVITGIFILPDTPQSFFWICSLWLIINAIKLGSTSSESILYILCAGFLLGLGMISKYTTVFFWLGFVLYIVLYERSWLRNYSIYISLIISILCLFPLMYWNYLNDFISFGFHSGRVSIHEGGLRFDYFLTELTGEILYSNPLNFIVIILTLVTLLSRKPLINESYKRIFLCLSLPLIFIFLFFSLFRSTLPHWTGQAYQTLLIPAAAWLDYRMELKKRSFSGLLIAAGVLMVAILFLGSAQIKWGLIPMKTEQSVQKLGKDDVTLDMYGWRMLEKPFDKIRQKAVNTGEMPVNARLMGENWFPLSHFDFYIAKPLEMEVVANGNLDRIHVYHWINQKQRAIEKGEDFWYMTTSRDFKDPIVLFGDDFGKIVAFDTIPVERNNQVVKKVFIYLLKDLRK